jgi:hypothetical protein
MQIGTVVNWSMFSILLKLHHNVNGFQGTCITFILFGTMREVWSLPCGYVTIIVLLIFDTFPEGVR